MCFYLHGGYVFMIKLPFVFISEGPTSDTEQSESEYFRRKSPNESLEKIVFRKVLLFIYL
jgi:hypothetical protein